MAGQGLIAQIVGTCCLIAVFALFGVGAAEGEATRRLAQSAPLWLPVVFGLRGSGLVKWAALPTLGFWFVLAALACARSQGMAVPDLNDFSPVGSAVALGVGAISGLGVALSLLVRSEAKLLSGLGLLAAVAVLQAGAYLGSMYIQADHHHMIVVD